MYRLNKKAYNILILEVEAAAKKDNLAGEAAKKIAYQRLNRLTSRKGQPVTKSELKDLLQDVLPNFSDRAISKAIKANRPPSKFWILPKIGLGLTAFAGFIWLINLPYPMIRRPVAKTAPILLLPSYISMDHNYRQAIAKVEQADQLVNQATSLADLELGSEKVTQAQKHLDKLPVWFLGYEPQFRRTFFSFGWSFTFDEFKAARASIGRMESKIFQETNAMNQLESAEKTITQAKSDYQQSANNVSRQSAIANWQTGIDELTQVPNRTLASKKSQAKLVAYRRDFQNVSGFISGNSRTNTLIAAAKAFSSQAIANCENPPLAEYEWQKCIELWQESISRLKNVPLKDPGYLSAQNLLASYQTKLGEAQTNKRVEADSARAFELAQSKMISLPETVDRNNQAQTVRQIRSIIIQLEKVRPRTTVYDQAKYLINSAEKKLDII